MKILHTENPIIEFQENPYAASVTKLDSFIQLDEILKEKDNEGYTHCFIYDIKSGDDYKDGLMVRWIFTKYDDEYITPMGQKLLDIAEILRK